MIRQALPEPREFMSGQERKSGKGQRKTHPVDKIIGRNLRIARIRAGYSQERLGDAVGITFQQIQKYENGTNRLSLSRAKEFASILRISVSAFFDDNDSMPSADAIDGPWFARWMALYATARNADRLSDIVGVVEHIMRICKLPERRTPSCL
ncbi:transcriptional regulator with XRE-family HTH domain [Bradyrhizobium diazoefficiens]